MLFTQVSPSWEPWSGHCLPGPETIALTGVTGSFISALLMLILSYTVNSCAFNHFTAHQKCVGAGLERAAEPMSQSSFGTSSTSVGDEPPLYLSQEGANCSIGTISFATLFFCFPVVVAIFFWWTRAEKHIDTYSFLSCWKWEAHKADWNSQIQVMETCHHGAQIILRISALKAAYDFYNSRRDR